VLVVLVVLVVPPRYKLGVPFVVLRVRLDRPSSLVESQLLRLQMPSPVCIMPRSEMESEWE
jgi:hypothetical protein